MRWMVAGGVVGLVGAIIDGHALGPAFVFGLVCFNVSPLIRDWSNK